jgi:hypothetical protein
MDLFVTLLFHLAFDVMSRTFVTDQIEQTSLMPGRIYLLFGRARWLMEMSSRRIWRQARDVKQARNTGRKAGRKGFSLIRHVSPADPVWDGQTKRCEGRVREAAGWAPGV